MISQAGKNIILRFVGAAKDLLMRNVTATLQQHYGIWKDGHSISVYSLSSQDTDTIHTAKMLRERLQHIKATLPETAGGRDRMAVEQLIAEQAFTILNRFCALRMCEERQLILPSVSDGFRSMGFVAYDSIAQQLQLPQYERYKMYIQSVFDELSIELPSVFDCFSPYGLIFPNEQTLNSLFELLNSDDLKAWYDEQNDATVNFWTEDETLGWIFQDYNSLEERRAMREASTKPRNSREMAVRNQFFTPEYIVRFLTDNSLGRIWYEMTGGKSRIAEQQCRYMVLRPDEEFAPREIKEPTEIRTLDPTCGSMHFGMYVYEVYEYIYLDAWDNQPTLLRDYRRENSRDSFRKLIPSLILEKNIYGCEIDPRALQLAALSLWLRAQRSYSELNILPAERPLITRSNLVLAEAMPGNRRLLAGLLDEVDPAMKKLLERVWDKMKYAGEAGLLFKMEQEIEDDIAYVRRNWSKVTKVSEGNIFESESERERRLAQDERAAKLARATSLKEAQAAREDFFALVRERLQEALQRLSTQLSEEEGYENALFADDATRGFAFIELCRQRFDCIVMNPPFGEGSENTSDYLDNHYPAWCRNLVCAFFDRMQEMLTDGGKLGAIFDRTVMIKSSYEPFRLRNLCGFISNCADTGWGVLDASVETSTLVVEKSSSDRDGIFMDVLDINPDEKNAQLMALINAIKQGDCLKWTHIEKSKDFANLPNSLIGYYFNHNILNIFKNKNLEKRNLIARQGHSFVSPDRFFRLHYELDNSTNVCFHLYHGGAYNLFYLPYKDLAVWEKNGDIVKSSSSVLRNPLYHMNIGCGYGKRGDILDAHVLKKNMFFTHEGHAISKISKFEAITLLSYINSILSQYTINQYCEQHKVNGYVNLLPMPDYATKQSDIEEIVDAIITIKRWFFSLDETNLEYHGLLAQFDTLQTISAALEKLQFELTSRNMEYLELVKQNDDLWMDLAGIDRDSDFRKTLNKYKSRRPYEELLSIDNASTQNIIDRSVMAQEIVQELVGMAFGRWDIRYAQGKKPLPVFGDVFDALPFMPAVTLTERPANYPVNIPADGILSNDPNSSLCLAARVREVIRLIWGNERADDIEYELCGLIGCESLQAYFENPNGFFAYHFKRYTKSRRKAPIYWPVSSSDGDITYWVYYPKLSHNTLPALVLKLRHEQEAERNAINAALSKRDKDAENEHRNRLQQVEDMMARLNEINNKGYKPNHDDGVPVTAAPLASFFQLRAWRTECEANLQKLDSGEYDWSHLAMSLYPARVTQKCRQDWCLALTHGLEAICENRPRERQTRRRMTAPQVTQANLDFNE